jgi:hypothetical protein
MADTLEGVRDQRDPGPAPAGAPTPAVTTLDGTPGGPPVTGPLEGNPEAAPAEPPKMTNGELEQLPEAERKTLAQKVAQRRFKDDARATIYERRDSMPLKERQELEAVDPESAAILDAQAGHAPAPVAPIQPAAPASAAAPAPAAPGAPAPVATNETRYKLSVYGKEQEVGEDEIIQAGIQALQKQHAADVRMREASTYEASLNAYAAELQRYADQVAQRASTAPGQAQPGTAGSAAPTSPGVAAVVDQATVRQALEAMENLDSAKATELMQKAINDAVVAGRAASPAPAPATPPSTLGEVPRLQRAPADPWGEEQRVAANRVFNGEFASFTDAQFNAAKAALDEAMADPANHGVKLENLVRTVCRTTARFVPATTAPALQPAPANPMAEQLESRRVLKARIPVTTPAISGRVPAAAPAEPRFASPSEYVQRLRQRSGSNSTR